VGAISRSARYGSTPVPILAIPSDLGKGIKSATTGKSEETRIRGAIRAGASVAQAAGIPGVAPASKVIRSQIKSDPEEVTYMIKQRVKGFSRNIPPSRMMDEAKQLRREAIREGLIQEDKVSVMQFYKRVRTAHERIKDR
jgi:hypothetical protein